MSCLLFLLECRTRCERNIGTNCISVRLLNLSSLLLPSSLPLRSHLSEAEQRHVEEDKKPVHLYPCWGLLHLCARKACSMSENFNAPKPNCQTELVVTGGHRHALLQDSQSLPAGNVLQLMEKEEIKIVCFRKYEKKWSAFTYLYLKRKISWEGWNWWWGRTEKCQNALPIVLHAMEWGMGEDQGHTWSSATPCPMGLQKWENYL